MLMLHTGGSLGKSKLPPTKSFGTPFAELRIEQRSPESPCPFSYPSNRVNGKEQCFSRPCWRGRETDLFPFWNMSSESCSEHLFTKRIRTWVT